MSLDLTKPLRFRGEVDDKIISVVKNPDGPDCAKLLVNVRGSDEIVYLMWTYADGKQMKERETATDVINATQPLSYRFKLIYWDDGDVIVSQYDRFGWEIGQTKVCGAKVVRIETVEKEVEV